MAKNYQEWRAQVLGHKIDLDNQSYDCVDVPKSWAEYVTGKKWTESLGWGNAKDIWNNAPDAYWERIPHGSHPQPGWVVCMDSSIGGGYGHTGVVDSTNGNNITILQQDTFTQQAVFTGIYTYNASYIQGYLKPRAAYTNGVATQESYERICTVQVAYRKAPNTSGELIEWFTPGMSYDFQGYVKGESVGGNDIWFVGRYTGGYVWSGGFADVSTAGLPNLTPAAALKVTERQIGPDAMNYRKTPEVAPDNVIAILQPGEVYDFDGYIEGMAVDGNNIWLRGAINKGYVWSGGLTNTSTTGLNKLITQEPVPVVPEQDAYAFTKDLDCVTQVLPAALGNFEYGNFPAEPAKAVLHDFGTLGHDTEMSTINQFKAKSQVSAHFVVAQKHIVQMVSLHDRAYHAGPNGNSFIGIELDPLQDPDTIASGRQLLTELRTKYGYKLQLIEHNQIMPTQCGDNIDLADYDIDANYDPAPAPLPTPVPTPTPTPAPVDPPLPPIEPTPVKPAYKSLEGMLAAATNVIAGLALFLPNFVLPPGLPKSVVIGFALLSATVVNVNLAIQRTKLKETAINQTAQTQRDSN